MINFSCVTRVCKFQCGECIINDYYKKHKYKNEMESQNDNQNDLLNDIESSTKPKFKLNPIGVYFVGSFICVVWKAIDIIIYLIKLI